MPTTRITEKLSKLISSQLPEYVRSEFPAFVDFLEAYYRFLEQDQNAQEIIQNARSYADIDRTADSFVQYFLKNYAKDIPQSVLANKTLLVKQISDLYESKGSSLSFSVLFRILFDTDVTVSYPYENVLRASDGTWQQLVSLRVETLSGDWTRLENHVLRIEKNNIVYNTPILKTKRLREDLTEVYLDPNSASVIESIFSLNDTVYVTESANTVFTGTITPTTTGTSIIVGGSDFKVGQVFKVNAGGAVNTLFRVTNTTPSGAVTEVKIINYGYDFTNNVVINFKADKPVGIESDEYNTLTNGFLEVLDVAYCSTSDPNRYFLTDYVEITYTGNVQTFTFNDPVAGGTTIGSIDNSYATIAFTIGALGRYPGAYTTNRGFISDNEIRLQDNLLYQPFAYQTTSDIDLSLFYDIVKSTIHPAGQQLYHNRLLENTINVSANVNVVSASNSFTEVYSSFETDDSVAKQVGKLLSDTSSMLDNIVISAYLTINNTDSLINVSDSNISGVLYFQDYTEPDYFAEIYCANPPEGTIVI